MGKKTQAFVVEGTIDPSEVPNWARRTPKWSSLIEAVAGVARGRTLVVSFDDHKTAEIARTTVRDELNQRLEVAAIRTRLVHTQDGKTLVYFTRLHDDQVVHHQPAKS